MTDIKLQGPENSSGFTHNGITYTPDSEGQIDVPSEIVSLALPHGFTVVPEKTAKKDDKEGKPLKK